MTTGIFSPPHPLNEPIKSFAPGSPEKLLLKTSLAGLKASPTKVPLVIGGEKIFTTSQSQIVCPHNSKLILGTASNAGRCEAQAAVAACKKSAPGWASMAWQDRAAVFLKAADLLATKYRPVMNAATMLGQSKSVYQAEIDAAYMEGRVVA